MSLARIARGHLFVPLVLLLASSGCAPSTSSTVAASAGSTADASAPPPPSSVASTAPTASPVTATPSPPPPPAIQAWMDRLTVAHAYDPTTGFIVARETIALPPLLADAPRLDAAIAAAGDERLVVVFVTADRCAPCQQFKQDALRDEAVLARLAGSGFLPTHLEVDREPSLADAHLGSRSIPMTYALRDGEVIATLRGQRSAADLLAWLEALPSQRSRDAGRRTPRASRTSEWVRTRGSRPAGS